MTRICFALRIKPELQNEYLARHSPVWPEMLQAIADSGRRNYSLFLGADGVLIGYYETDSVEESQRFLDASPIASKWEAEMSHFFDALEGRPDQAAEVLAEVFNLDDQIAASHQ